MDHVVTPVAHQVEVRLPLLERAHPFRDDGLDDEAVEREGDGRRRGLHDAAFSEREDGVGRRVEDRRARGEREDRVDDKVAWLRARALARRRVELDKVRERARRRDLRVPSRS